MEAQNPERRRRPGISRGQSVVELAISLPLMMLLIMGVVDFGWVLYAHIQVAAASYEGARAGAVFPGDRTATITQNDNDRADVVRKAIFNSSLTPPTTALGRLSTDSSYFDVDADVTVTPTGPNDPMNPAREGQEMVVKVGYHQPVWFAILPGISGGKYDVSTTTKVRIQ